MRQKRFTQTMWSGQQLNARHVDDADATGGASGTPPAATAGSTGQTPPATPAGDPFLTAIFDSGGKFKEGWRDHFKDEIGDSKYFDSIGDIKTLVKSTKGLASLKGRALVPKADASDEEWDKTFQAMGIPEKPEDYGLEIEGLEDKEYARLLEKNKYTDRLQAIFKDAGIPTRQSAKLATAILKRGQADFSAFKTASQEARSQVESRWGGKVKWDDAVRNGREALARLCEHSETTPSEDMAGFLAALDNAGLTDHPFVVSVLHRLATRQSPGKFVTRTGPTGPGVKPSPSFASRMMPQSLKQVQSISGR